MKRHDHYLTIDILRIFAAILVLLNHFATFGWETASVVEGDQVAFGFLSAFAGLGAVGVEIFFVISGFVIAMSASGDGGLSQALRFTRIRAIRILPALWLSALVSLIARACYGEDLTLLLMDFCRSVILSPKGPYIDGVVWSLVVEAIFYFLVAIAILSKFRLSLYDLAKVIGFSSTVYVLIFSGLHLAPHFAKSDEWISILSRFQFKALLLQHGVFFAVGMILFSIKADREKHGRREWKLVLLSVFSAMGMVEIFMSVERPNEYKIIAIVIWVMCMCAMAAGIRYADLVGSYLEKHKAIIIYLGGLSYPIYLNHYSVGMIIVWAVCSSGLPAGIAFVLSASIVLGLSMGVMWLERKIQTAVKSWFPNPSRKGVKLAV
ncbi:acyltransferase family protein [Mesorhizobium waimense]|nr:acyltransferase [Mesorhizobium waimense]